MFEMPGHGGLRRERVLGDDGVCDLLVLLGVQVPEFLDTYAAVGAFPLTLPYSTASSAGKVAQKRDQHGVASDMSDGLVKRVIGPFASGAVSRTTTFLDLSAQQCCIVFGTPLRRCGRDLRFQQASRIHEILR